MKRNVLVFYFAILLEFSKNSSLKINILASLLPMPPPLVGALGTPPISPIAFLAFVV